MQVVKAGDKDIPFISDSLAEYFSNANLFWGYSKYKEDADFMADHVKSRILDENSEYCYLVAEEDDEGMGFVNYMVDKNNIGTILLVSADNIETKKALVMEAMNIMKGSGVDSVEVDILAFEKDLLKIFKEIGIEEQSLHFKIK